MAQYESPLNALMNALPQYAMQLYQSNQNEKSQDREMAFREKQLAVTKEGADKEANYRDEMLELKKTEVQTASLMEALQRQKIEQELLAEERQKNKLQNLSNAQRFIMKQMGTADDITGEIYTDEGGFNKDFFNQAPTAPYTDEYERIFGEMEDLGYEAPGQYLSQFFSPEQYGRATDSKMQNLLQQVKTELPEFKDKLSSEEAFSNLMYGIVGENQGQAFANQFPELFSAGGYNPGVGMDELYNMAGLGTGIPEKIGEGTNKLSRAINKFFGHETDVNPLSEVLKKIPIENIIEDFKSQELGNTSYGRNRTYRR